MRRPLLAVLLTAACSAGAPAPITLDTRNESCAWCRMAASDASYAAQLVAPSEEPRFFDDIGCLSRFLAARPLPRGAVAYVADHRTKAWVRADSAVYTRVVSLETPMGSHWIAHADAASRDADPVATKGVAQTSAEVFGPAPPGATP